MTTKVTLGGKSIRIFCKKCGKELWDLATWDHIKHLTLEELEAGCVCSDCMLAEIRDDHKGGELT